MANNINTIKSNTVLIAKAAAKELVDNLQFCKSIDKADESDYKGKNGYSAGDTINISKRARFIPISSFNITSSMQDIVEEKVPLALDILSTVPVTLDSQELASTIDLASVYNRAIKPAIESIAQNVEQVMLQRATQATYNLVGTPGSTTFDVDQVLQAKERMSKFLAPQDGDRNLLFDSTAGRSAVGARKGLFQAATEIAKQYKQGYVGQADGFNWMENELGYNHTAGTRTGTLTITTTVSSEGVSSLAITGTGAQTMTKGDVFTVGSVFAVHPITKKTYNFLQPFVVTALNTASSSSYTAVAISPSIYSATSLGLQNVSALPQSSAAVTMLTGAASSSYQQNLTYHRDAFRMVSVPLVMPDAVEIAEQATYKGVTVAIVRAFDILQRRMITRVDFLGGIAAVRPEWSVRISA